MVFSFSILQSVWQICRKLCDGIPDMSEAIDTRQHVVHVVGHWAMCNGELIKFLSSAVDSIELEAVLSFLHGLAYSEINAHAVDAPCVDLFVSYLLKQGMYKEAVKVLLLCDLLLEMYIYIFLTNSYVCIVGSRRS